MLEEVHSIFCAIIFIFFYICSRGRRTPTTMGLGVMDVFITLTFIMCLFPIAWGFWAKPLYNMI